jgi:[ribosomal protein S5]-alanine N-acetyltransferase
MNLTFETPRLLLRPFKTLDAVHMFAMDQNPNVHKYLWQKPAQNIEETYKIIDYIHKQYNENKIGRFATILKETGEFIGWTGIKYVNDHVENGNTNFYDYGYRLNEKFWNNGYATEATIFWLEYGFKNLNIDIMNAYTHAENGASNRVLSKCGMNFVEDYPDNDGTIWKWWQMENPNL